MESTQENQVSTNKLIQGLNEVCWSICIKSKLDMIWSNQFLVFRFKYFDSCLENTHTWRFFPVSSSKKFKLAGSKLIHRGSSSFILMNSGCNRVISVLPSLTCRIVFAPVGWTDLSETLNQSFSFWKDTLIFSGRTVAMRFWDFK